MPRVGIFWLYFSSAEIKHVCVSHKNIADFHLWNLGMSIILIIVVLILNLSYLRKI